ncbi:OsmC family protein [Streptococcus ovuberis]|uniref:Osmotically inducible protein OsmC n=1 Tax=Streptococcus ovuberis TaxID=1936207 RepID=A0A7X6MZS5_9STRE|nr:OsmC family protein [Streptococcus ovuberis]NKZ21405.1 osmotically inducible protein OsmC [Streptococcus ovuberis]
MLYTVTAVNHQGINGTVKLSNEKVVPTSHPLNDQPGFNPEELLALAWSTCLNATIEALLDAKKISAKSTVSVTVDLLKEPEQTGYYFRVLGQASIQDLSLDEAQAIVQEADQRCPVSKLLAQAKTVTLETVAWTDPIDLGE